MQDKCQYGKRLTCVLVLFAVCQYLEIYYHHNYTLDDIFTCLARLHRNKLIKLNIIASYLLIIQSLMYLKLNTFVLRVLLLANTNTKLSQQVKGALILVFSFKLAAK